MQAKFSYKPLLVLALLNGIFYLQPLISRNASIHWDTVDAHYTALKYLSESLHQGAIPFWTNRVYSGFPFIAEPEVAVFYPINFLLAGLLHLSPWLILLQIAIHSLIAACGMYLLAQALYGDVWAACIAAMSYAFGGFFVGHTSNLGMQNTAAWIPWLIYCHWQVAQGRKWLVWTLAGSAVWANIILAGHFQTDLYSGILFAVLAIVHTLFTLRQKDPAAPKRAVNTLLSFGIILIFGIALSAIQLLPSWELLNNSFRPQLDFVGSRTGSLNTAAIWTFIAPNAYGIVTGRSYLLSITRAEGYLYCGIIPLLLALFYLIKRGDRYLPAWAALGIFGLLYMFSDLPLLHKAIYEYVPFIKLVRNPERYMSVVYFAISLMAASGFTQLRATKLNTRKGLSILLAVLALVVFSNTYLPYQVEKLIHSANLVDNAAIRGRANLAVSLGWSGLNLLLGAFLLQLVAADSGLLHRLLGLHSTKIAHKQHWLLLAAACFAMTYGLIIMTGAFDGTLFLLGDKYHLESDNRIAIHLFFLFGCACASIILAAIFLRIWHSPARFRYASRMVILVAFLDLYVNGSLANHLLFARKSFEQFYQLSEKRPIVESIRSKLLTGERVEYDNFGYGLGPLNQSYLYGFDATHGFHALGLKWYSDLGGPASSKGTFQNALSSSEGLKDLMRVKIVVEETHDREGGAGIHIRERELGSQQFIFAQSIQISPSPSECIAILSRIDPLKVAVVESRPDFSRYPADAAGTTKLLSYHPERLKIQTTSSTGGLVVLGEIYYPGWTAYLDGQETAVHQVDCALRGVVVPAGEHEVELRYRPRLLFLGAWLSLAGIIVWGLLFAYGARRSSSSSAL